MKKVSLIVSSLAVVVAFSVTAQAATQAKTSARTSAPRKEAEAAASTQAPAAATANTASTTTAAPAASTDSSAATTSGTTTATAEQVAPEQKGPVGLSYGADIFGPGFTKGALKQPSDKPVLFAHALGISPRMIDGLTTSLILGGSTAMVPVTSADFFKPGDPTLLVGVKALSVGNFSLTTQARYAAPIVKASRDQNTFGVLAFRQIAAYELGSTGLSFNAIAHERIHMVRGSRENDTRKNLSGWFTAGTEYKLIDNLAATLYYYTEGSHINGTSLSSATQDGQEFDLGVSWDIAKGINFNPVLVIPTSIRSGKDAADNMQLAGTFSAAIL